MRTKPTIITNHYSMQVKKENLEFNKGCSRFINEIELISSKETAKEIREKWEKLIKE